MNESAVAASVACVDANTLTEELFRRRDEWTAAILHQVVVQPRKCDIGSAEASVQRTCVELLRCGDFLRLNLTAPEVVCFLSLGDAVVRQMGIAPDSRSIAVDLGPVAIPCRSSVIRLCSVMVAFAMPTEEQQFVSGSGSRVVVQRRHLTCETLPLSHRG